MGTLSVKEYGSDFHLCLDEKWLTDKNDFFDEKKSYFFLSGRAALYALIEFGIKQHKWKKIYLPSFYCYEVNSYIQKLPIQIQIYNCNPYSKKIQIDITNDSTNAVVCVDYFGLGMSRKFLSKFSKIYLIDDLTHNLKNLKKSKAHYVFASLRKELPVPVGGVLYSDFFYDFEERETSPISNQISYQKITAMYLKLQYLNGKIKDKSFFRKNFSESEGNLSSSLKGSKMPVVSKEILNQLDISKILNQKNNNLKTVINNITLPININLNNGVKNTGFGIVLKFKSQSERDDLKIYLIKNNIYPAILWPNQLNKEDIDLENKMLFIHIDYRYTEEDIKKITKKINMFFYNGKV